MESKTHTWITLMCVMHIDSILEKNRSKNEDIANEKYMYFEGRFPIKNTVTLKLVQHINQYTFYFFYKVIKKPIIIYIFKIFYLLRIILFILKVLVQL